MKGLFVTGTDTGVGKTFVTGLVGRYLQNRGYRTITQKWIQTGSQVFSGDIKTHLKLMHRKKKDIKDFLPFLCPYTFKLAASPHLAAKLEKYKIRKDKIKKSFKWLSKNFDFVIVEGIGGALVPFNEKELMIDIARELNLPALIVASNKLGAINHTLLTIEAVKSRNIKIIGVIFNNQNKKMKNAILKDNPRIIKRLTGERMLGILPYCKDRNRLYKAFLPIANKIL